MNVQRIPVIHEQHMVVVDQHEVRDEVLRRYRRLLYPAQLHTGIDPREDF